MLRLLKDLIVPHPGNSHHPHVLRNSALLFLCVLTFVAEGAFIVSTISMRHGGLFSLIIPESLVQFANASREDENVAGLTVNPLLQQSATLKALDMAKKGYFSHVSPDGTTPWSWFGQVGYQYTNAGENLAVNFIDSRDVHTAWMESPGHRANILNEVYTEIGIATATGVYQGREAVFVVQHFGKRASPRVVFSFEGAVAATQAPSPFPPAQSNVSLAPLLSSPRRMTNNLFLIIGGIILLALVLTIFIRIEFPHTRLLVNPAVLVVVIAILFVINFLLGFSGASIG